MIRNEKERKEVFAELTETDGKITNIVRVIENPNVIEIGPMTAIVNEESQEEIEVISWEAMVNSTIEILKAVSERLEGLNHYRNELLALLDEYDNQFEE